jgi:hypothetical protein
MQRWQNKIRRLRQFLRGWAKNMNGAYRKEKQEHLRKAEELDKKSRVSAAKPTRMGLEAKRT